MSMSFTLTQEQAERLLAGFDSINMGLDQVRAALSESANAQQIPEKNIKESSVPSIDGIRWKVKGGGDASPSDTFAYAFTSDQSGRVYTDLQPVVDYLKRSPAPRINGFEVSLSKDAKFINRKKL
jgi:hypothetical protein